MCVCSRSNQLPKEEDRGGVTIPMTSEPISCFGTDLEESSPFGTLEQRSTDTAKNFEFRHRLGKIFPHLVSGAAVYGHRNDYDKSRLVDRKARTSRIEALSLNIVVCSVRCVSDCRRYVSVAMNSWHRYG